MNSLLLLGILLLVVLLILLLPVKRRRLRFDEKGEAIKVYQEEVEHIQRQAEKGFIDPADKARLLAELDKKSALAITAIEKKTFTYQSSLLPISVIFMALVLAAGLYYAHYRRSGVMDWQIFNQRFASQITEGLFDERVVHNFIAANDIQTASTYCFAMQRQLLAKYDSNPDALAGLATCYATVGYPQLAEQAITRGLKHKANHIDLNYLLAELEYNKVQRLSEDKRQRLLTMLTVNPNHPKIIRLLAIDSLNQGHYPQAKFFFTRLRQLAPATETDVLAALDRLLQQIDANLSASEQTAPVESALSPNHPPMVASTVVPMVERKPANPDDVSVAETKTETKTETNAEATPADSPTLTLSVTVSEALAKTLTGDQVLFIIIKTPQGQLLNASKYVFNTKRQPLSIGINDNTVGMMQLAPMAGHATLAVVARISLNDSPMAASGDLTSAVLTLNMPQQQQASLVIDRKVP